MRRFNENILRRTEAARKSNKRAQVRLQRIVGDTSGGYEDTKKSQILEMTRQQNLLKRELLGIQLDKIRAIAKLDDKNKPPTNDVRSADLLPEACVSTSGFSSAGSSRRGSYDQKDFGKNYFGYKSSPGMNTDHQRVKKKKKNANKKNESAEEFNVKAGNEVLKIRTQHKLKEQQIDNLKVKEKLDKWKIQQQIRNSKSKLTSLPSPTFRRNRRHSFTSSEDNSGERKQGFRQHYKLPPVDARVRPLMRRRPSDDFCPIQIKITDSDANNDVIANENSGLFDAEIYAPDGRVRKLHRLPDFEKSFEESKKTKYVRTKEKRDYERYLTVDEIFS